MDYPEVPVGCMYFNPRRLRRHARKQRESVALALKRAQEKQEAHNRREEVRKRVQDSQRKPSFKTHIKGFVSRLFGRKTG